MFSAVKNQATFRAVVLTASCLLLHYSAISQYSDYKYKKKHHSSQRGYQSVNSKTRYFSVGAGINLNTYGGDLTPNEDYILNGIKVTRPGISVFGNYKINHFLNVTGDLSYGRIVGDDFYADPNNSSRRKYIRNLSFRNDLISLSLRANFDLLYDPYEFFKRRKYNIYLFTGLVLHYSNPKAKVPEEGRDGVEFDNAGDWVALRPLGTEGQNSGAYGSKYKAIQVGIPLGAGFSYRLSYKFDLKVEASMQYILSDYIDDIGSRYVDLGALDSDLAKALSDRSMEETAVRSGDARDMDLILSSTREYTYVSEFDGETYTVFRRFGHEGAQRGGSKNDLLATFSVKVSYILSK